MHNYTFERLPHLTLIKNIDISGMAIHKLSGIYNYSDVYLEGNFSTVHSGLVSLEGAPLTCHNFHASDNELTNLIGAPRSTWVFSIHNNKLSSIEGAPLHCSEFRVNNNHITSLKGIGREFVESANVIELGQNIINSDILGVLLIKNVNVLHFGITTSHYPILEEGLEAAEAVRVLLKYAKNRKEIILLDCKEELMALGLKRFARL